VPSSAGEIRLSFAPVVKRVAPAVVNVYAARVVENRVPLFDDPIFRRFFGGGSGGPREQVSAPLGSGVIVDATGSSSPTITSSRMRTRSRSLSPTSVNSTPMSSSRTRAPISPCCASRTAASVSPRPISAIPTRCSRRHGARHRQSVRRRPDRHPRHRVGGGAHPGRDHRLPVLHPDRCRDQSRQFRRRAGHLGGRLVGINTAIFSRSGGSQGIGFAIPANMVRAVVASARAAPPCAPAVARRQVAGGDAGHSPTASA